MARLLGLLILLGLAWVVVKRVLAAPPSSPPRRAPPARFEKTVRCERCGVHLPVPLARAEGEHYVCTEPDCARRAAPRRG